MGLAWELGTLQKAAPRCPAEQALMRLANSLQLGRWSGATVLRLNDRDQACRRRRAPRRSAGGGPDSGLGCRI